MTPDDSRRSPLPNPPKRTRVLVPLICGSIALHLLIVWAFLRFPSPSVQEPETTTEIQLSDLPAPTIVAPAVAAFKPPAAPAVRPPTSPQRRTQPARPEQPRPRPTPREIVPTALLVRSTREVAKTEMVAKKPVAPRSTTALPAPTFASPAKTPPAKTPSSKIAQLPGTGDNQKSANGAENRAVAKTDVNAKKSVATRPTQPQPDEIAPPGDALESQTEGNSKTRDADTGNGPNNGGNSQGSGSKNGDDRGGNDRGSNDQGGNDQGGNGNGSGGGPFEVGAQAGEGPRRIVYILDVSFSMEPRLERAKEELNDALTGLQADESFNIIAFYGNVRPFDEKLVAATPANIAGGRAFIDSLRVGRYTNLELAFEKAFAAPGVNVVVLITDGVPTYGLGSPDFSQTDKIDISANFGELAGRVRQLNRSGARIYTVGIASKNPDGTPAIFEASGLLQRIATESGGTFKTVRIMP